MYWYRIDTYSLTVQARMNVCSMYHTCGVSKFVAPDPRISSPERRVLPVSRYWSQLVCATLVSLSLPLQ